MSRHRNPVWIAIVVMPSGEVTTFTEGDGAGLNLKTWPTEGAAQRDLEGHPLYEAHGAQFVEVLK